MAHAAVAQAAGPDGPSGLAVATWAFGLAFTAFLSLFPFVFLLFPSVSASGEAGDSAESLS
jgi:hypothetical protein